MKYFSLKPVESTSCTSFMNTHEISQSFILFLGYQSNNILIREVNENDLDRNGFDFRNLLLLLIKVNGYLPSGWCPWLLSPLSSNPHCSLLVCMPPWWTSRTSPSHHQSTSSSVGLAYFSRTVSRALSSWQVSGLQFDICAQIGPASGWWSVAVDDGVVWILLKPHRWLHGH